MFIENDEIAEVKRDVMEKNVKVYQLKTDENRYSIMEI